MERWRTLDLAPGTALRKARGARCSCIDRRDGHGYFGMGNIDKDLNGDEESNFGFDH